MDRNTATVRAFVRDASGNFTNFDPADGSVAVYPISINSSGQIEGYYSTSGSRASHSFLRDTSGTVTLFDMTGAVDTYASSLNDSGVIVGVWDNNTSIEGFQRNAAGKLTNISIFGRHNRATRALGINNSGRIAGSYQDANTTYHGFVE